MSTSSDKKNVLHLLGDQFEHIAQLDIAQMLFRWLPSRGNVLFTLLVVAALFWVQSAGALVGQAALSSAGASSIHYQGDLADSNGVALNGSYTIAFALYDATTGGNLVWGPESHAAVAINNGKFDVGLGSQTEGGLPAALWNGDRFLEITIEGETLSPREQIRSVPIAGMALTVPDAALTSRHVKLETSLVRAAGADSYTTLTNEYQTIPGTTITLNPETAQTYLVVATMDIQAVNDSTAVGQLAINGARYPQAVILRGGGSDWSRGTVSQSYLVHLEPGEHTLDLQAYLNSGTTAIVYKTHTTLSYIAVAQ